MTIANQVQELTRASGARVRELMEELSQAPAKELLEALHKEFSHADQKRQGSFAYLFVLAGEKTVKLARHENPFVREAFAKALLHTVTENDLALIKEQLETEESYRIKKHYLQALANCSSPKAIALLESCDVEPELFLEKLKLLPAKKCVSYVFSKQPACVVQVPQGFEELWKKQYPWKSEVIAPGWISVHASKEELEHLRTIYYFGELVTQNFSGKGSVAIKYSNAMQKEKTALNKKAASLQNQLSFHPDAKYFLCVVSEEYAAIVTAPDKDKQKEFLPASIQDVVAANIALLEPEKTTRIVDPFCGAGTLLREHNLLYPFAQIQGFDKNEQALVLAKNNLSKSVRVLYGNAMRLPLRELSVDRIVCNPPFNKRVKIENISQVYKNFFKEAGRVLQVGGVLIVYTTVVSLVYEELKRSKKLFLKEKYALDLDAVQPTVFVLEKRVH